jgi:formate-dependent phosphoribosylglycinamide formyltransferase (GAR transformylase)
MGVVICREPADVAAARSTLGGAERIVLERFLDIRRSLCVHVVIETDGRVRDLGAAEQVCDERGHYGGNWLDPLAAPPEIARAAASIATRAAALGYRGFAGIDMAECADGRLRVLDLNFRLNGSTAAVLLYDDLARTRGLAVMRLRTWKGLGSFAAMIAAAREATAQGFLVPLSTYRPSAAESPRLLGLVLGTSRDEVRRREQELEACGVV